MKTLSRRSFLRQTGRTVLGASFAACSLPAMAAELATRRTPNFVVIFTDDQGYSDVGCFGAEGFETPNLDRMAQEGMRFTDFHVSQAVCSASRSALMTGCYNIRVGIFGALMPFSNNGLNPAEETIAEVLKKKGYTSGAYGKWHLGHHYPFLPLQQGFDDYLGLPYSNDMWPVHYDGMPITEIKGAPARKLNYPPLPLIDGNVVVDHIRTLADMDQLTTRYTERAVSFIKKNKDKPFFLYVPHSMTHVPLGVSEKFRGKSRQGMYGDVVMEIDWSVGQILQTLKDLNLDRDTLVIFMTDNGPWLNFGNHAGSARPLREGKGTMWEGGCRVPCIMRWPGVIPAGTECNKLASTIDILPTLATLSGAPLPEKKIDGVDISPLLKGDKTAEPRNEFIYYYGHDLIAVRRGPWKLVMPHTHRTYEGQTPGRDGWPGPVASRKAPQALYNLDTDISEKHDVSQQHPDIVKQLEALAETARRQFGDKLTHRTGNELRPAGQFKP